MKAQSVKEMFLSLSKKMVAQEKFLCELDSFVGDGDHGVTVARGFSSVQEKVSVTEYQKPAEVFKDAGDCLSKSMGGAIGPILGSLFLAGAKKSMDKEDFGAAEFAFMFEAGLKRIQIIGGAQPGDRTMVDAIAPAVEAMKRAVADNKNLADCLEDGALAAKNGAEKTKDMVARKGRARFLQDKSAGYVDAGATTTSLILRYMADYAKGEQ